MRGIGAMVSGKAEDSFSVDGDVIVVVGSLLSVVVEMGVCARTWKWKSTLSAQERKTRILRVGDFAGDVFGGD